MKRTVLVAAALLAGVAPFNAPCATFPPEGWQEKVNPIANPHAVKGGILRFSASQPPKSLNYYVDPTLYTHYMFSLMFETLLGIDPVSYEFTPGLASRWEISDDGLTFTFELDKDARWSDGVPVTPEDVQWTYDAIMNASNATGPFKVSLGNFKRPEIVGERKIRFQARQNHWRNLLGCGDFEILPKHAFASQPFNRLDLDHPVVSGPYIVSSVKEQIEVRLARRPDWWAVDRPSNKGTMNFDTIVFRYFADQVNAFEAFKKGITDIYPVYSARMWANETIGEKFDKNWIVKARVHNHHPIGFQGFAMNMRRPPFDDLRVRKAIAHLVDRKTMNQTMMFNAYFMLRSYFSDLYDEAHPCTNRQFEYDEEKAEALLREAGYVKNPATGILEKDGRPFSFTFLTRDSSSDKILVLCNKAFKKVGIEMKIDRKDWAAWMCDMDEYNFDITWASWSGSVMRDTESMWLSTEADKPASNNVTGLKDPQIDALIEKQKTVYSVTERNKLLRQIDARLTEQVPYVLLWNINAVRLLYWDAFGTPRAVLSKYGDEQAALCYWWYDADSAAELKHAMTHGEVLPKRPVDIFYDER